VCTLIGQKGNIVGGIDCVLLELVRRTGASRTSLRNSEAPARAVVEYGTSIQQPVGQCVLRVFCDGKDLRWSPCL
jgi:hypothetical protein